MYEHNQVIDTCEVNISESFCHFTKLKGFTGNGEARLFMKGFKEHRVKTFFSDFRDDNEYFFLKSNLLPYINNAAYEYFNQESEYKNKKGYRNDISKRYVDFKKYIILLNDVIKITKNKFEISSGDQGHYIRPDDLTNCNCKKKTISDHPWNFFRDITLPKISKIKIDKVRHFAASNYAFYFLIFLDIDNKNFIYHNSYELIQKEIEKINLKYSGIQKMRLIEAQNGRGFFRHQVLLKMKECQITGLADLRFLEAAHIKPWSKSSEDEKIDGYNGIMLTPNCHKLFDIGMISFDEEGKLIKSKNMPNKDFDKLFRESENIKRLFFKNSKTKEYLEWHRLFVFEKFNFVDV